MLTYSVLPTPKNYSERSKSVTFSAKIASCTSMENAERKEQLRLSDESLREAYDLLWNQQDHESAITLLKSVLLVQQQHLGKHDKQVGLSCCFLGTAFWISGDNKEGLKYMLEAKRLFSKSGRGNIKGIDQSISCILQQQGLGPKEITAFKTNAKDSISHELQGDSYNKLGQLKEARDEYAQAKAGFHTLTNVIR